MKKIRLSLTVKLTVIVLVVTVFFTMLQGTVSVQSSTAAIDSAVEGQLSAIAANISKQVYNNNEKNFMVIRVLASIPEIRDSRNSLSNKAAILAASVAQMSTNYPSYENFAYCDRNGKSIMKNGNMMDYSNREYFQQAMQGKEVILDPFVNKVTNALIMQYVVPVRNENNVIDGAIIMILSGNPMIDFCKSIDLGENMHPAIINRTTGSTIANANPMTEDEGNNVKDLDQTKGLGLVIRHIVDGETGNSSFTDPFSKAKMTCSYTTISDCNWSVFCAAPYNYYYAKLNRLKRLMSEILLTVIVLISVIFSFVITYFVKPLRTVKDKITEIAKGNADLTQRLPAASKDEIGDVVDGFNSFIEKLQAIVGNISESKSELSAVEGDLQSSIQDTASSIQQITANIDSVNNQIMEQASSVTETSSAVTEISSNIESLERMIDNQSAGVTNASSAVEQMIGNINSVNSAVEKMVSSFTLLEQNANNGIRTQSEANERIKQIEEQSKMLKDANAAIANIAAQTNLLAMNAAIEAAHAGESGKGFSVVADEIRKLSETSTQQSKTIGEELKKIEDTIVSVVSASQNTNTALSSVSTSISETSQIISQIKGAMEEQQIGSKQIIESLNTMNNSTSEVKLASTEMTEGNKQILIEVEKLQGLTANIKNNMTEMQNGLALVNESGTALSKVSEKVDGSVKQIGSQIDLFKIQ